MTRRRMLVTGGSGTLGGWVVRMARAEWGVTATYLRNPGQELGVDWRELDVRDSAAVAALFDQVRPKTVIHTAALNPGQGTDFEAVNAVGTQNVAQAAALVQATLIYISSDVVFDGEKGSYVEEDPPSPITEYGRSKAQAEEAVRTAADSAVIVRTSLIYGPLAQAAPGPLPIVCWRQWDRQTRWIVGDLKAGKPVHLFTDERRCPIWVESIAAAVLELAEPSRRPIGGIQILHVAGAQDLSRYAFGLRLARFHGIDPAHIRPALSRTSGMRRPLDCTLDSARARALLSTPLPGVDEILGSRAGRLGPSS